MSPSKQQPIYEFQFRPSSIPEPEGHAESVCVHISFEVTQGVKTVAAGHAHLLRLRLAERFGFNQEAVFGCINRGLEGLHPAVMDPKSRRIRSSLVKPTDFRDVLYVDCIKLIARQRGRNLGLWLLEWLRNMLGEGCAAVVLEARPVAPYQEELPEGKDNDDFYAEPIDKKVYAVPFATTGESAKQKLRNHFAKIGFKRIGTTDFMVFDMSELPPPSPEYMAPD